MKSKIYNSKLFLILLIGIFINPFVGFSQFKLTDQIENSEYLKGSIVIKVKEGIGPFEKQERSIDFGIQSLDEKALFFGITKLEKRFKHRPIQRSSDLPDLSRIYRIEFSESQDVHKIALQFAKDPNIEYAEAISLGKFTDLPSDPLYDTQQHLPQIMADEAWDVHKGEDGEEVVVAIVDTGADWLHPDLTENCWQNLGEDADGDGVTLEFNNGVWERDPDDLNGIDDDGNGYIDDVIGWDFHEAISIDDGSNPDPLWNQGPFEHGTHCAGISAGRTNNDIGISSVSWNIKYMPIQTDDGNNTVLYGIDGVVYAAENGADVISCSWYHGYAYSQFENDAIQYAIGLGSIVCFAASNDNSADIAFPGGYPGVISVAAVNPDDTRASFSNYGIAVDIAAPGVSILSTITNNNYASWNGTSMAAPMVAGLFGLLKSYQPDWSNDQLIEQIIGTADDIDFLNPDFENALGSGRINAYRAVIDENVEVPQELRLEFRDIAFEDENANGAIEAGETVSISFSLRNYAYLGTDNNTTISLITFDPDIEIISGTTNVSIPLDSQVDLDNVFEFRVAEGAESHQAFFTIEVSSDMDITYGSETEFAIAVAPSGFFVWEGEAGVGDYSGSYIRDFLEGMNYEVTYSNSFPSTFAGYDAVFLSFGNAGENLGDAIAFEYSHSLVIQEYLENGGTIYSEGSPFFLLSEYFNNANHEEILSLYGLVSGSGTFTQNPISKLIGSSGSLFEGMVFNGSNQNHNWYIDRMVPAAGAIIPFSEENYGDVAIYNEGEYDQKTFHFSYSLAQLIDEDPISSRYNVLVNIMELLGYPSENDIVAAFQVNKTEEEPDFVFQFTDWSIAENDATINSWAWDFNEDGEIDSYDQNPSWTYTMGGVYDVSLIISGDGGQPDTLTKKDFMTIRSGILVYEGEENANGYSGTYIKDYLVDHYYDEVGYANKFPSSLSGYDAVFVSYGNTGLRSTELTNQMSVALYSYSLAGGKIYIEGGNAISSMNQGSLWAFGMDGSEDGEMNELSAMIGLEDAITNGLEFNSSSQYSQMSIDSYSVYEDLPGTSAAFTEADYGIVAVQFDGSQSSGQKTFCMSYAIANLVENGNNTSEELLERILNFFDVTIGVEEDELVNISQLKLYPNPAKDQITLQINNDKIQIAQLQIFDVTGRLVSSKEHNLLNGSNTINYNISGFESGIYYLRLQSEKLVETLRWVKVD